MNSKKRDSEEGLDRFYEEDPDSDYEYENTKPQIESENSDENAKSYVKYSVQGQIRARGEGRRGFWYRVKDGFLRRTAPFVNRLVPQEWRMTKSQRKLVDIGLANNIQVNVIDRETRYGPIVEFIFDDIEEETVESLTSNDLDDDQIIRIIPSLAEKESEQIFGHPSQVVMNMISQEIEVSAIETGTDSLSSEEGVGHSSGYESDSECSQISGSTPIFAEDQNKLGDQGYEVEMVAAINIWHFEAVRDRNRTPTEIAGSHSLAAVDCIFPLGKLLADCSAHSQSHMIHGCDSYDNNTSVLTHSVSSSLVDTDDISFNETYQDLGDTDSIESSIGQALARLCSNCLMTDSKICEDEENADNSGDGELTEEFFETISILSIYSNNSGMDSSQTDGIGLLSESYMCQFFNEQDESILSLYSEDTSIESSHSVAIGYVTDNYLDQFYEDMSTSNISIDSENTDIGTNHSDGIDFSDDLWDQYSMSILSIYSRDVSEDSRCNEVVSDVLQNQWTQIQRREQMEIEFNRPQSWMNTIDLIRFFNDFRLNESNQRDDQLSQDNEQGNIIYDIGKIVLIYLYVLQLLSFIC